MDLSNRHGPFWGTDRRVAAALPLRGNAVPDAHVAALLRQHGVSTLYTNDTDFKRFDFLRVVNPFIGSAPPR